MTKLVLKDNFYYILAKLFFEIFVGYKSGDRVKKVLPKRTKYIKIKILEDNKRKIALK